MKTFTRTKLLAAAALAAATFTAPAIAHAGDYYNSAYEDCKKSDTEAQIIGGVLGALAGGILGSNVAASNAQDEGTVIGAGAGAAAGIAIANKDCKKRHGVHSDSRYDGGYATRPATIRTVSHPGHNRSYNRGYSNTRNHGYNNRGYNQRGFGGFRSERQVRYEIERLKDEAQELRRRKKYGQGNPYRLANRLGQVKVEIKRLKRIEDRFQDRRRARRAY